jgi:hypothetical protein
MKITVGARFSVGANFPIKKLASGSVA